DLPEQGDPGRSLIQAGKAFKTKSNSIAAREEGRAVAIGVEKVSDIWLHTLGQDGKKSAEAHAHERAGCLCRAAWRIIVEFARTYPKYNSPALRLDWRRSVGRFL